MTKPQQATAALDLIPFAMLDGEAVVLSSTDHTPTKQTRAVFVGGAGALKVRMSSGKTVTLTGVLAGAWLPLSVTKVFRTGTTATNIVALW